METKKDPWTLQQKFGFQDDDLKSSKHDNIMLWLDANIPNIIDRLVKYDKDDKKYNNEILERGVQYGLFVNELPQKNIPIIQSTWEYPVTNNFNKFLVGFIDLFVKVSIPRDVEIGEGYSRASGTYYYWDIKCDNYTFAFEVKSVLPTIGELVRQIRLYQQFCNVSYYIVASQNDKYSQVLLSQGIGFINYDDKQ